MSILVFRFMVDNPTAIVDAPKLVKVRLERVDDELLEQLEVHAESIVKDQYPGFRVLPYTEKIVENIKNSSRINVQ